MAVKLTGSVGKRGANEAEDVKVVQKLLNGFINKNCIPPYRALKEDGNADSNLEQVIAGFQMNVMELSSATSIVEPGSKTLAALQKTPVAPVPKHTSRSSFVGSKVKENDVAKKLIDKIWSKYPKSTSLISAYLSPSDLYWKVNYHWDALRTWLEYAEGEALVTADEKKKYGEFLKTLKGNSPSKTGHYKVDTIGKPEDTSSEATIEKRCGVVQKVKKDLAAYNKKIALSKRKMKNGALLKLVLAPIAMPKKSNHVHGWALDIKGPAADIKTASEALGASLIFNEDSHIHVEYKNGAKV